MYKEKKLDKGIGISGFRDFVTTIIRKILENFRIRLRMWIFFCIFAADFVYMWNYEKNCNEHNAMHDGGC